MPFDPTLPANNSNLSSAEMRGQFNALKALIDGLQQQIAPLTPVLNRDAGGNWTLVYTGPAQSNWQVWARYTGSENWSEFGELQTADFPATDDDMAPDGVSWWQIKICGEDGNGKQTTLFSNVISFGPVP